VESSISCRIPAAVAKQSAQPLPSLMGSLKPGKLDWKSSRSPAALAFNLVSVRGRPDLEEKALRKGIDQGVAHAHQHRSIAQHLG
jgi:hypothetical protein